MKRCFEDIMGEDVDIIFPKFQARRFVNCVSHLSFENHDSIPGHGIRSHEVDMFIFLQT